MLSQYGTVTKKGKPLKSQRRIGGPADRYWKHAFGTTDRRKDDLALGNDIPLKGLI